MEKKDKIKSCTVYFEPAGIKVQVSAGTTLLEAAQKAGVYLGSVCGGDGYCGKCRVTVSDTKKVITQNTTLLSTSEVGGNVVLACQAKVIDDVTISVPELHTKKGSQILTDSTAKISNYKSQISKFPPELLVCKIYVKMSPPTVHDHTDDLRRLYLAVQQRTGSSFLKTDLVNIQNLSKLLQDSGYKVTATISRCGPVAEIIAIEPNDRANRNFALAVDIGTTTVVAHLVDLTTSNTIDTEAMYNSQIHFGEDYIRRIIYAEESNAFDRLQSSIAGDINNLIAALAARNEINVEEINAIVCSGNTAMIHFLLKLDSRRIRREPYIASANFIPPVSAAQIGLRINRHGLLYPLPGVAAYVGGDIVAGVLATQLYNSEQTCLLADIGTNGEVVLGNRDWLVCASSSAGPAFEGSGIKHGIRACCGAIEKIKISKNGSVEFKTIENKPPVGICGSGLLDSLAELFINGIIDRTGRFKADYSGLSEGEDGLQFRIVASKMGQKEIVITQADIDNLIRSKAGVFAAIKVLMESTQTKPVDLGAIYLAGGFGNFLDIHQAVTVGMLPDVPVEKIHYVGNTSIAGAKMVLLSRAAQETADKIAHNMTYFDLMSHPQYMDEFIKAKFLPHTDLSIFPSVTIR
jgi:uncharacterized 2Fe-2S/4Fe-4S cluster protein (DUF4445 family)